jgi:hypothetical protein
MERARSLSDRACMLAPTGRYSAHDGPECMNLDAIVVDGPVSLRCRELGGLCCHLVLWCFGHQTTFSIPIQWIQAIRETGSAGERLC